MKFKATNEQVKQIAANAVNASAPMGMGFLQATNKTFDTSDFNINEGDRGVFLDYVQGRMVKLSLRALGNDEWQIGDNPPRGDYQSWVRVYPTNRDLIVSVPGVVITEEAAA